MVGASCEVMKLICLYVMLCYIIVFCNVFRSVDFCDMVICSGYRRRNFAPGARVELIQKATFGIVLFMVAWLL